MCACLHLYTCACTHLLTHSCTHVPTHTQAHKTKKDGILQANENSSNDGRIHRTERSKYENEAKCFMHLYGMHDHHGKWVSQLTVSDGEALFGAQASCVRCTPVRVFWVCACVCSVGLLFSAICLHSAYIGPWQKISYDHEFLQFLC